MTLKTRLAAMMIVLLVAVMALQALLMQREQQALAERIEQITDQIDVTTRRFSESALEILRAGSDPLQAGSLFQPLDGLPDSVYEGSANMEVVLFLGSDSTHVSYQAWRAKDAGPVVRRFLEHHQGARVITQEVREDGRWLPGDDSTGADGIHRFAVDLMRLHAGDADADSGVFQLIFTGAGGLPNPASGRQVVKVHVPVPAGPGQPAGSVQLVYPMTSLTEELAKSRWRSWAWLAGLLGVGATGAVLLAVQFTRPIRSLEASFEKVVGGDLDVTVQPERPDEIGRLTASFNKMVGSLREKRAIEERLAETERLAAVGQLAAGVAHEVRNPLNAMRLTMEQLTDKTAPADGSPERERFDHYTGMVTTELARLERLVTTFLDLSRDEEPVREAVDLSASLGHTVELFRSEFEERGVVLSSSIEPDLRIVGDPARLPTVWNNLVANALQAVETGGTVSVAASRTDTGVSIVVVDDGVGIASEDLPRIWEPFFSGKREGTGLGLSLVRAIVERHDGEVHVESDEETGTRMTIRFPGEVT